MLIRIAKPKPWWAFWRPTEWEYKTRAEVQLSQNEMLRKALDSIATD